MTLRTILHWPDPALSRPARPVGQVDDAVRVLAADLLETMYTANGRGLAAPQVGEQVRVFVMDTDWKSGAPTPMVFVDPRVTWASMETAEIAEACLSIPGVEARLTRPAEVRLVWTTLDGDAAGAALDGSAARIAQHEIDHLDGIVTLDRLEAADRVRAEAETRTAK